MRRGLVYEADDKFKKAVEDFRQAWKLDLYNIECTKAVKRMEEAIGHHEMEVKTRSMKSTNEITS